MKKSELRKIVQEEYQKILGEAINKNGMAFKRLNTNLSDLNKMIQRELKYYQYSDLSKDNLSKSFDKINSNITLVQRAMELINNMIE